MRFYRCPRTESNRGPIDYKSIARAGSSVDSST